MRMLFLFITGHLAFASNTLGQAPYWHKIITATFSPAYCHLQAEGDYYQITTNQQVIEVDHNGTVTRYLDGDGYFYRWWTAVLKRNQTQTGHPYFLIVRRDNAIDPTYGVEEYVPGVGIRHEAVFADSIGSLKWPHLPVVQTDDSCFVVFGRDRYRKIIFTEGAGFSEKWSRSLGFAPTIALLDQQAFVLADETGIVKAVDQDGAVLWQQQYGLGFHAFKAIPGGFIGCGLSPGGKAVLIRLAGDGTLVWMKTGSDREFFDVLQTADGGFAVTGTSVAANILLARYDAGGELLWNREFGYGSGISIVNTPGSDFVIAGKGPKGLHLIKTDANGLAPAAEISRVRDRQLTTHTLQTSCRPGASIFFDGSNTGFNALAYGETPILSTFTPWIAGIDDAQQLHLAAGDYDWGAPTDYRPGMVDAPAADFNRVWKITRADIRTLREDFARGQLENSLIPFDIASWPAKGNQNLKYNLDYSPVSTDPGQFPAPFVDLNGDGIYNVFDGDYPDIQGDQMLWWAFTDSTAHAHSTGNPLLTDVFATVFAYDCVDNVLVDQSIFLDLSLLNRSDVSYGNSYLGFFTDIDLGCYIDDYIGTLPSANAVYVYNAKAMDSYCIDVTWPGFGSDNPVPSILFLNQSLDYGSTFNSPTYGSPVPATTDPKIPLEFYNYLQGKWKDGTRITRGGNGYAPNNTDYSNFTFLDNPADPQGWSMCTANLPFLDQRLLPVHGPFSFDAGKQFNIRIAFTLHPGIPLPCPDIFGLVQPALTQIQQWHDTDAFDLNSGLEPVYVLLPGQTLNLDASVPQGLYQWSTGAATPTISVNAPGTYSVTITGATGCSKTETVEVRKSASAGEPTIPEWRLWPNPTTGLLQIQMAAGSTDALSSRLFDAQGRLLGRQTGATLDLSGLPAGLYWVELRDKETGLGVRKVVKE